MASIPTSMARARKPTRATMVRARTGSTVPRRRGTPMVGVRLRNTVIVFAQHSRELRRSCVVSRPAQKTWRAAFGEDTIVNLPHVKGSTRRRWRKIGPPQSNMARPCKDTHRIVPETRLPGAASPKHPVRIASAWGEAPGRSTVRFANRADPRRALEPAALRSRPPDRLDVWSSGQVETWIRGKAPNPAVSIPGPAVT